MSLVVNMDAARLGLGDSRRIEIDVTAAARALGAAVGPQVAHLSAMMQQAAQVGQMAAEGHSGAQPGAGAAAGEVPTKCWTAGQGCLEAKAAAAGHLLMLSLALLQVKHGHLAVPFLGAQPGAGAPAGKVPALLWTGLECMCCHEWEQVQGLLAWSWLPKLPLQKRWCWPLSFGGRPLLRPCSHTRSACISCLLTSSDVAVQGRRRVQQRAQVQLLSSSSPTSSMSRGLSSRRASPRGRLARMGRPCCPCCPSSSCRRQYRT